MESVQNSLTDPTFGRFRLDARDRSLWHDGRKLPLRSRSLDILRVLVAASGQLVAKGELIGCGPAYSSVKMPFRFTCQRCGKRWEKAPEISATS